jgi:hypothetical protein
MAAIDTTEVNKLLEAVVGKTAFSAVTGPAKLRLMTAVGSDTAAGTQVTGGSYVAQSISWASAASRSIANDTAINFTGMPAATVTAVEVYDNANTRRLLWGSLAASKTVDAGDTLSFAIGALVLSIT